jgi:hypothetical protein
MQKQNIVLIPPSDEQAYPVFHVARELAGAFLAHLADLDIEVRDTPMPVGNPEANLQNVIEIEVMDDKRSIPELEAAVNEFFEARTVSNG